MAANSKKVSIKQSNSIGSRVVVNDSNVIDILVTQMRYLSNTLHHLSYIIQSVIISSNKDLHNQSTESTYKNVSNAFHCLHYFYDLLSYLEWELQYLRNNTSGLFFKKCIPVSDKQYDNYVFRYDVKLNADMYYKKKDRLKEVTKSNSKLRDIFYDLYDEIEDKFQEAKKEFINYLRLMKCYNLHYELMIVVSIFGIFDSHRKMYPNDSICKIYNARPFIYLIKFIKEFKTDSNTYDKTSYSRIRMSSKNIDDAILEMTNKVIDQSLPASVITYMSLKLNSVEFINYLAASIHSFSILSVMNNEVSYMH
jgi:hypothetical protein